MPDLRFDPSKAVHFDLTHGRVLLEGAGPRVLVPAEALAVLTGAAGAQAEASLARAMGDAMGRRVALRLGEEGVEQGSVEIVLEHLGGELALAGLGSLGLERWGQALVLVVDHCPQGERGDGVLEGLLAAALAAAVGRDVHALRLGRDGVRARFLLGSRAGIDKVRAWLAEGVPWGEALVRLHQAPGEPAGGARGPGTPTPPPRGDV